MAICKAVIGIEPMMKVLQTSPLATWVHGW